MQHLRDTVSSFADETTAHGFRSLKHSPSVLVRALWIISLVVVWIFCGYQTVKSCTAFFKYESKVAIKIKTSQDARFPAVSICNLNPLRLSAVTRPGSPFAYLIPVKQPEYEPVTPPARYDYNDDDDDDDDFDGGRYTGYRETTTFPTPETFDLGRYQTTTEFVTPSTPPPAYGQVPTYSPEPQDQNSGSARGDGGQDQYYQHTQPMTESKVMKSQFYSILYNKNLSLVQYGHRIQEMLLECSFQSRPCQAYNFTRWDRPQFGNCYTIFTHEFPSYIGPDYGLTLSLTIQDDQYLSLISPAAGFQGYFLYYAVVQVHAPEYAPFPADQGFSISPGASTSVGVKVTKIVRLPLPYDCTDCGGKNYKPQDDKMNVFQFWRNLTGKVNYTDQVCLKSCYLLKLARNCKCIDATQLSWSQAAMFKYWENGLPPACNFNDFATQMCYEQTTTDMVISGDCNKYCPQPCEHHTYSSVVTTSLWPREDTIDNQWAAKIPGMQKLTPAFAAKNFARLVVYFEDLNFQSITESPAMDIWMLLSNIGGTLGLYAGASFLTILEFGEFFGRVAVAYKNNKSFSQASTETAVVAPTGEMLTKTAL